MDERITTRKVVGIRHGYLKGHAEVDEWGLTEEVARKKVEPRVPKIEEDQERRQPRKD